MTSLEAKLLAQASAFSPLTSLLTAVPFPWYDNQLQQGSPYPAVVVQLISNPQVYALTGRMATSQARVQFTIWDIDPERARQVEQALFQFLDNFNAVGPANLPSYPNEVVGVRQTDYPQPSPKRFTRQIDAMIFQNQTL
jgi:hypothetical protein